jgi:hypothetical protein
MTVADLEVDIAQSYAKHLYEAYQSRDLGCGWEDPP